MRKLRLLLSSFAVASVGGAAFALAASYIHFRLDASAAYTSFCNINASVNCDSVLQSPYARLAGVPVAWLGIAAHAALAFLALAGRTAGPARGRLAIQAVVLGSLGSAAFSALMAFLSFSVLQTACLMCIGLYAVAALQLGIGLAIPGAYAAASPATSPLFAPGLLSASAAGAVVAAAALGRLAWPGGEIRALDGASLEDLRAADPEFFDWYLSQPVGPTTADLAADPGDRRVVIVEFSDFECAYCRRNHEYVRDLEARNPDGIHVVHRHFPLDPACNEIVDRPMHPRACRAAEAAECARLQGRYGEMADVLFANQQRLFEANLERLAERAGLDLTAFQACMASRETLSKIVADTRAGGRLGIKSTPTVFFNGRRITGTFADAVKYDLAVRIETRLAAGESPTK